MDDRQSTYCLLSVVYDTIVTAFAASQVIRGGRFLPASRVAVSSIHWRLRTGAPITVASRREAGFPACRQTGMSTPLVHAPLPKGAVGTVLGCVAWKGLSAHPAAPIGGCIFRNGEHTSDRHSGIAVKQALATAGWQRRLATSQACTRFRLR